MTEEDNAAPATKLCTKCREVKALDDFYRSKRYRDGRRSECKRCELARSATPAYRAKRREKEAANADAIRRRKAAHYARHRADILAQQAVYRSANPQIKRQYMAEYGATNAARIDDQIAADRARLRSDGMKRCSRCRRLLEFAEFSTARAFRDGLQNACRECAGRGLLRIASPYWLATGITSDACYVCGAPREAVDHIYASSIGGPDAPWNLLPICTRHNAMKRARPLWEFIDYLGDEADPDLWLADPLALVGATLADGSTVDVPRHVRQWSEELADAQANEIAKELADA